VQADINRMMVQQEGVEPDQDVGDLVAQYGAIYNEFHNLIVAINAANNIPLTEADGLSISELIVRRDITRGKAKAWKGFLEQASNRQQFMHRLTSAEQTIRYVPAVPIAVLRAESDRYSREAQETDLLIQRLDWLVEVDL